MNRYVLFFLIVTSLLIVLSIFNEQIDFLFFASKIFAGILAAIVFYFFERKR